MTRHLVFLDTETDGLHPGRRAWEVAMIRRDVDGSQREISFFVALNLQYSDLKALQVGRFFDRHPAGRKISGKTPNPGPPAVVYPVHDAARTVMEWTFDATIVAAVPSFDMHHLERMVRAEGYVPAWDYRLRCVESMAFGAFGEGLGGLRDCCEAFGVEFPEAERHTALGDARAAMRLYDAVLADSAEESESA